MPAKRDISKEILDYLRKHPDASDTLEGITEWWLMSQKISYEMERVKAVVERLIKQGCLVENQGKDLKVRYQLNPERRKKA